MFGQSASLCARFVRAAFLIVLLVFGHTAVRAADAICAQVKIEIKQKLSLERQAFDAMMRIDNGLDIPVQNVHITLSFTDATGSTVIASSDPNHASASFFMDAPTLSAINAIDGTGVVAPKTSGQINWLIIPSPGAGGALPQGKLYFVGASLTYLVGSETKTIDVTPDTITVLPQPELTLDYFLAKDVYADDAFTPETEPPVPFTLGVRVKNSGGGKASAMTIESAQPKIIENKQGLAIGFQIIDSFVNDQAASKTLLLNFGDIGPGSSAMGRWDMVTTLSGKFVEFTADYTHADALGGALTSLVKEVNAHLLVHDVKVDLPGRDNVRDFLALDGDTLRVYESDSLDTVVTDRSTVAHLQAATGDQYGLSFPATSGFAYVKLKDPKDGQVQPGVVVRSDGKQLPTENVWLSKTRNEDLSWAYFINFFDVNTTGSYKLTLAGTPTYSTIAGKVYIDSNNNGIQDAGESGIGATAVTLTGTDDQGAGVNTIGYAEPDGIFKFVQLNPGTYALQVGPVQSYDDGIATVGSAGGVAATASITNIVLGAGAKATGYTFAKRFQPQAGNADVVLTMNASTASVKVGDTVTFELAVKNDGPSTAKAVSVTDQLPAGLTFVSSMASAGSFNTATGVWTVGDLVNAATATLTLGVKVTAMDGLTNAAKATSASADPNAANNTASVMLTPQMGNAMLTIGLLAGDYRVAPGEAVTLLASVNNYGPDAANGVAITLTSSGLTFASGVPSRGGYDSNTGIWTIDALASGASATLALHAVNVGNMSSAMATINQVNGAGPTSIVQGKVTLNPVDCGCADLGLDIVTGTQAGAVGTMVDWTVTATNRGANPAVGTIASIPLPAALSFTSAQTAKGTYDAASGQWSIGTLHPGDSVSMTLRTSVNSPTAALIAGTIHAVDAGFPYADLTLADNSAEATFNATASNAAVHVSQSIDKANAIAGDLVTITLIAGNDGPLPATGVVITDLLPAGMSFVSATASQGNYDPATGYWSVGALGVHANATLNVKATMGVASRLGSAALIYADQIDGAPADNVARSYVNRQDADVAVTLAADNVIPGVGQSVNITVSASNQSVNGATGVAISALLPQGFALISANAPQGSYDINTGLWKLGSLPANTISSLTLKASVNVAQALNFVARVHETLTHDGNTANNEAQLAFDSTPQGVLTASIATDRATYQSSDQVIVSVDISNSGNVAAQAIAVDVIVTNSAGAQVHSASQSLATLAAGASGSLNVSFGLNEDGPGAYTITLRGSDAAGHMISAVTTTYTVALPQGLIEGIVYDDTNADDQLGASDPGLAGVAVALTGTDSRGANVAVSTVTDVSGVFSFGQLNAGTYALQVVAAQGYVNTIASAGLAGGTPAAGKISGIVLTADSNTAAYSFAQRTLASFQADLSLAIVSSHAHPLFSDTVTLTVTVTNSGPATASDVVVQGQLPAGLSLITASASAGSYDAATGNWSIGDMANGSTVSLAILVRVNAIAAFSYTASASAGVPDANHANNSAGVTLTPVAAADIGVTVSASNNQPMQNDVVVLTVTISNAGPSTATGVILNNPLPAGLSLVSAVPGIGSYDASTGIWTVGDLAKGASATLTINALINSASALTNTANATSSTMDPVMANNSANVTLTPLAVADLGITVATSNQQPPQNSSVTLSITVNNAGPSAATGTSVQTQLPAGLSYISATASNGSYNSATGLWTVGDLANGGSASLNLEAKVTATSAMNHTASVTSTTADFNSANNSAGLVLTPVAMANLGVSLAASNVVPLASDIVVFTINVNNLGPSIASAVTVAEHMPIDMTFVSATTATGSFNSASGVWTVGDLAIGAGATLSVNAKVNAAIPVTNTVSASTTASDPDPSNNTASVTLNPIAAADLSIALSANNLNPNIGDTITLTVTANNAGPSNAEAVAVSNQLPSGLSFVSAETTTGSYNNSTGVWTMGSLASGASATLSIKVKATSLTALHVGASVSATTIDPNSASNMANVTINPVAMADLGVTMSTSNVKPKYGETVAFTIAVNNAGPSAASLVAVGAQLSAGLTFVSATTTTGNYNSATGIWTLGTLVNAANATLTLNAKVATAGVVTNAAGVTSETNDANSVNNTASVSLMPVAADVGVSLAASSLTPIQNETVVLTITANNTGPSTATGVKVTDKLPAGLTFVSAVATIGSYNSSNGLWTVGDLAANANATLTLTAKVITATAVTNSASTGVTAIDPNPANNTASVTLTPVAVADLALAVSVNRAKPKFGDTVNLTIKVRNAGPASATAVSIINALPSGLTFVSAATVTGNYISGNGIWTVGDLAKGATATLTINAKIATVNQVTNTASVTSATFDPNSANNSANVTLTPASAADLGVTVSASSMTPVQNELVELTVAVSNAGPSNATAVTLTDRLPGGLSFVSATATAGIYSNTTGAWVVGDMASGTSASLTIKALVTTSSPVTNKAKVKTATDDPVEANDTASVTLTPVPAADLAVNVSANNLHPQYGSTVVLTVKAHNAGPAKAIAVSVTDLLPAGLTLVSATTARGNYDGSGGTWAVGDLANGATATLKLTAKVVAVVPMVNSASVASSTFDPNHANNSASLTLAPPPAADVGLTLSASTTTPNYGDSVTLTMTVNNAGPSTAAAVALFNKLGNGLSFVSATATTGGYSSTSGIWTVGELASGASASLTVNAKVASINKLTNKASVSTTTFDPNKDNKTASITLTPGAAADVRVTLSANNVKPKQNTNIVLTVKASNAGPSPAVAVLIANSLPAGLSYVSSSTSTGSYDSTNGKWNIGDLAKGASATLQITASVAVTGALTDTANVSSATLDPNVANNNASVTLTAASAKDARPGINLDVQQTVVRDNRLLVMVSCEGLAAANDPGCVAARKSFLTVYLTAQGFDHKIVSDPMEFQTALRCGRYNTYWLSGASAAQIDVLAAELQEAVYRGDGLLLDGVIAANSTVLEAVAGAAIAQTPAPLNAVVKIGGTGDFVASSTSSFIPLGKATPLAVTTAAAEAVYGAEGGPVAMAANQFGLGRSVTTGFDLLGTLGAQGETAAAGTPIATLLTDTLRHIMPPEIETFAGGEFAVFTTSVRNNGEAATIEAIATLPPGAMLAGRWPSSGKVNDRQVSWSFPLAAGQSQVLDLGLRLPTVSGTYILNMAVNTVEGSTSTQYGVYSHELPIAAGDQVTPQLIAGLQGLSLSRVDEQQARDIALTAIGAGKYLTAIEALDRLSSVDVRSYRVALARLQQEQGRQWCTQLPMCSTAISNAGQALPGTSPAACYPTKE